MREPRNHTYFADRCIDSDTFVAPLLAEGFRVERFGQQDGLRPTEDSDELWIRLAADCGWIGLSCNWRIGQVPEEIDAVMESGLALFVMIFGRNSNHEILAQNFLRTANRIDRFLRRNSAPFIAKVSRPNEKEWNRGKPGSVRMFRDYGTWSANNHRRR